MAATGDGKGGRSITSTSAYQVLFEASSPDGSGSDGAMVAGYNVRPVGEDAVVEATFFDGTTRVYNAVNGADLPILTRPRGARITKVEAKGETGLGVPIYGNVLIP